MSGIRSTLAAALLMASTGIGQADEKPFLYFATHDPFVTPGASTTRNDLHIFGGVFVEDTFGRAARLWDADYTSSYMIGAAYGRDFHELGAGFVLGGVTGAALRFGADDDTSGELWAGLRIRHHGLVIGGLAIEPGFSAGLSLITGTTEIERERERYYDGDATFLGFLGPEVAFRFRQAPNLQFVYQLHHRSGGDGIFGDMGETSNASTFGVRYRF